MRTASLIAYFVILFADVSHAQEVIPARSVQVASPSLISTDKQGNIYLALTNGSIDKYTTAGDLVSHYSPEKLSAATLIEAWNPLRIFLFYRDFQEYVFLDRFLTTANRFSFSEISSYIGLASISADNNLWLIDYSDFSLKKYNLNFNQVTIERPLDLVLDPDNYDLTFMREYQNLLFIADKKNGVLVFDNLGNYLRKFDTAGLDYFSFIGDELYFINAGVVSLINIYSGSTSHVSLSETATFVVMGETKTVLISGKAMTFLNRKK